MIEIKEIKITPPKWWIVLIFIITLYLMLIGDVDTIKNILKILPMQLPVNPP